MEYIFPIVRKKHKGFSLWAIYATYTDIVLQGTPPYGLYMPIFMTKGFQEIPLMGCSCHILCNIFARVSFLVICLSHFLKLIL